MKIWFDRNRENETPATRVPEPGAEAGSESQPTECPPPGLDPAERLESIAVLDNEVQAGLVDTLLSSRGIPHIMQSYHDSAYDGLFQGQKGWGIVLAPAAFKSEIQAALEDIRREATNQAE